MKEEKGFAVLEGLLVLVIIIMLAGISWYVHSAADKTDKTLSQTNNSLTSAAKTTSKGYFKIPEWGVQAPYNGPLNLIYKITTQDGYTWAYVSSSELNNSDHSCTTDGGYGGVINRLAAGQQLQSVTGGGSDQTIEQAIATSVLSNYSRVGNYYYYYEHPQASCGQSESSNSLQSQTDDAVKALVSKLQAIPQ